MLAAPPTSKYTAGETLDPSCSVGSTNCTVTTPLTTNETITLSGDVSGSGTTAITSTIAANAIEESMLKSVNGPTDELCLTYETTTGDFEWQSCGSTYTAGGTLLNLTSGTFSVNEGTLTNGQGCLYSSGVGLVCNSNYLTTVDISDNTNLAASGALLNLTGDALSINQGTLTDTKFCTYETGTGLVCNADGGGLTVFTEAQGTASPNDTIYANSLSATGAATNIDLALIPKGTGALLIEIPDGTDVGGNKRGNYANDFQNLQYWSSGEAYVASGAYSLIAGGTENKAVGDYAAVLGGDLSRAITNYSFMGGGKSNLLGSGSGGYAAAIIGGTENQTQGDYTVIVGGQGNGTLGYYSFAGGGYNSNAGYFYGDDYDAITGGYTNDNDGGVYSFMGAGANNDNPADDYVGMLASNYGKSNHYGEQVQSSGRFAADGDAQRSTLVARVQTTNATETELFLNGSTSRIVLPSDTAYYYDISIVGRRTDTDNESAGYRFRGAIDNNAGTVALVGSQQTETEIEDSAWSCAVTADDANNSLDIKCTGETGKTINWVAFIELTEVTG